LYLLRWRGSVWFIISERNSLLFTPVTSLIDTRLFTVYTCSFTVSFNTFYISPYYVSLLNTRRDRSRGIRDDVTYGEPEIVPRELTWPPRPVSQLSRAIGRPFGTKYDNIDQNKAEKEGPGGARGQTGSRNMAATRFFDSATPTSYLTSNESQCLSHAVTQFYSVNIKSRPKYTTTSGFANPLQV